MRKLQENLSCYLDKMADREVFAAFTSIINKSKKFTKPDVKVCLWMRKCVVKFLEEGHYSGTSLLLTPWGP